MKPKISLISLRVDDMERSVRFYRDGLGFPMHNYKDGDDFAMFRLEGSWLAVHPREAQRSAAARAALDVSLARNEPSPEAVDTVFAEAIAAGATVVESPQKAFWGGYSGCFTDPDGYVWEVAYNPFTDLT
jgi:hypothetical protein